MFCFQSPHFIISCPHLAKFDLIPALHLKGFRRHLKHNSATVFSAYSKLKCILFVCPNVMDNLVLPASSPPLLCPSQQYLSIIGWRAAFSIWSTPANGKCAYSRIRLINGRSERRSRTECFFRKCLLLLFFKKYFPKLIFSNFWQRAEETVTHYWLQNADSWLHICWHKCVNFR